MRAGCKTGRSNITNHIALAYAYTWLDALGKSAHVQVLGFVRLVVPHLHIITVALGVACLGDRTICNSHDRSAMVRGIVSTKVTFIALEDWMESSVAVSA